MAQSDRQRLLALALALPQAADSDFFKLRPPSDAKPDLLKRINDTTLRTKLVEVGLAEGLQSPKGPQKIASIVRIYPAFDAPARSTSNGARHASNGRAKPAASNAATDRRLPSIDEMETLIARIRSVESEVERSLAARADERIDRVKGSIATLSGDDLEAAYVELGEALEDKRALRSQIQFETFARIEADTDFPPRAYLRFLRR
jgi:hypothetical protein